MKHEDFNFKQYGFVGHLAEPDAGSDRAVIVIMGGEQSILPGIKFAERFADYGITGLAVSLFGADGIPDSPNQIPLDMFLPAVKHMVTGMWVAYYNAYQNEAAVQKAKLAVEQTGTRVLLIAGQEDEAWPAEHSVREIVRQLKDSGYKKDVKVVLFPHGSHLSGLMPNREREKRLYRMIPLIGLMYKTFGKYRKENLAYFAQSEKEIIDWVKG